MAIAIVYKHAFLPYTVRINWGLWCFKNRLGSIPARYMKNHVLNKQQNT